MDSIYSVLFTRFLFCGYVLYCRVELTALPSASKTYLYLSGRTRESDKKVASDSMRKVVLLVKPCKLVSLLSLSSCLLLTAEMKEGLSQSGDEGKRGVEGCSRCAQSPGPLRFFVCVLASLDRILRMIVP